MKTLVALSAAILVGITAIGCDSKTTTSKKTEVTTQGPGGESKTTVEQKVETTPDSQTRTTTEKTEKNP